MKILPEYEGQTSILSGYIKNRTKEATLAALMLALFFVARNFSVQVHPLLRIDFTAPILFTAAAIFSWPYTIVFAVSTLYLGTGFSVVAWLFGNQTMYFLSRLVGKKYAVHMLIPADVASWLGYGLALWATSVMNPSQYISISIIPEIICAIMTYTSGLLIWGIFRKLGIIE